MSMYGDDVLGSKNVAVNEWMLQTLLKRNYELTNAGDDAVQDASLCISELEDTLFNKYGYDADSLSLEMSTKLALLAGEDINNMSETDLNIYALSEYNAQLNGEKPVTDDYGFGETLVATDDISDLEDTSVKHNYGTQGALVQAGINNIATTLGLHFLTNKLTDRKWLSWGLAIGGNVLLHATGVLGNSIEPVLNFACNILPDGGVKDFLNNLRISTPAREQEALTERSYVYANTALKESMETGVSADAGTDIKGWMYTNGKSVASHKVFETVAEEPKTANVVGELMSGATGNMGEAFDSWVNSGAYSDDEVRDRMRIAALNELDGLVAYNSGAVEGIRAWYSNDPDGYESAMKGLMTVNQQSFGAYSKFLLAYNEKYHFLTDNDLSRISSLDIAGVNMADYGFNFESKDVAQVEDAQQIALTDETQMASAGSSKADNLPCGGKFDSEETVESSVEHAESVEMFA